MNKLKFLLFKLFLTKKRTRSIINQFQLDQTFSYSWGMKKSGRFLRRNLKSLKVAYLEDGFIHSFGIKKAKIPFTICIDKNGIYYNSSSKSDLFNYFNEELREDDLKRSKKIIRLWKKYEVSKYNFSEYIKPPNTPYVLLVDQIHGDLSLEYGEGNVKSFEKMFDFATKNWPNHKVVIKIHPDVMNYKKKGCLNKSYFFKKNVQVISEVGQINKLLEFSSAVCVVTSQVGFEALIYGKEVHVFGKPFYSGLGLTIDHEISHKPKEIRDVSLEKLVYSTLVKYQICVDPRTHKKCKLEDILEYIYIKRRISNFFPENFDGLNLTPWKARQINRFIYPATGKRVQFFRRFNSKMQNIIVWGKNLKFDNYISKVDNFISVEDGFVRSVGLGSDLYPPYSLLFDKKGIHYDASKESDIEYLLQNTKLKKNEIIRSKKLIKLLVDLKISKYNLNLKKELVLPNDIFNKKIVAVLGQVETDSSIKYGVPNDTIPKTNFSLVEQVRADYPDSFIIYKPHPDTESGLRAQGIQESSIKDIADFVAFETPLDELFNIVDKVVVFTSLGGFEALIRGLKVVTYGFPFYAGWGLTIDKLSNHKWAKRRTRLLNLEELVFISLITYPFYTSLKFNCITEIENVIEELLTTYNEKNLEQVLFKNWGILKDRLLKLKK